MTAFSENQIDAVWTLSAKAKQRTKLLKAEADEAARIRKVWEKLGDFPGRGWCLHVVALMEKEADFLKKLRAENNEAIAALEQIYRTAKEQAESSKSPSRFINQLDEACRKQQLPLDRESRHPRYSFERGFLQLEIDEFGKAALLLVILFLQWHWVSTPLRADDAQFAADRRRMVAEQLAGPGRGLTNARVLSVMGKVPRHECVPASLRAQAYDDRPLPIGHERTISQPFIVAFMTENLEPKATDKVLEIGTGCGYQAAVLAELVAKVYTIEIVEPLALRAEADLKRPGHTNVLVRAGDGYKGWPEAAPFDAVIVTCAPDHVPQPLVEQLKEGGRMIIPVGPLGDQELFFCKRKEAMSNSAWFCRFASRR